MKKLIPVVLSLVSMTASAATPKQTCQDLIHESRISSSADEFGGVAMGFTVGLCSVGLVPVAAAVIGGVALTDGAIVAVRVLKAEKMIDLIQDAYEYMQYKDEPMYTPGKLLQKLHEKTRIPGLSYESLARAIIDGNESLSLCTGGNKRITFRKLKNKLKSGEIQIASLE